MLSKSANIFFDISIIHKIYRFSHQIEAFSNVAKHTHNIYGTCNQAAVVFTFLKVRVMAIITPNNIIISIKAHPASSKEKKIKLQAKFNTNWTANNIKALFFCVDVGDCHIRKREIPIRKYNVDQTIPNKYPGGLKNGFSRDWYHSFSLPEGAVPEIKPALIGMAKQIIKVTIFFIY